MKRLDDSAGGADCSVDLCILYSVYTPKDSNSVAAVIKAAQDGG